MVDKPEVPDPDATVMVPRPGRRRPDAGDSTVVAMRAETAAPVDLGAISGLNPVVAAANPLLAIVPRIRSSATHPDPAGLRDSLLRQISTFEQAARAKGIPPESIVVARYALCTVIDEAVAHTPWGGTAEWAKASLLVTLHREVSGGEKFFQLLNKMAADPAANIDLLELYYVCLALGFEGRFRIMEGGKGHLETVRQKLAELIRRQRGEYERDLAASWRGQQTQVRRMSNLVPLWVSAAVAALVVLAVYFVLSGMLEDSSEAVAFAKVKAPEAPPRVAAPPPPKPVPPRLSKFLQAEIGQKLVEVQEDERQSRVTIRGDGLFDSGSARIRPDYEPVLARIADAINGVQGAVLVTGHTDSVPTRTIRYPNNWELSKERADNVVAMIAARLKDPKRIVGEGKGSTEPADPKDPKAAVNRRVEITVAVGGA